MTDDDSTGFPDGWVREDIVAGMDTVGNLGFASEYPGLGGGYNCSTCSHYIPIEALDEDDDTCPRCSESGMVGTVIMGRQEVTAMYPDGWFDEK